MSPSKQTLSCRLGPGWVPLSSLIDLSRSPARRTFWSTGKRYRLSDPQGEFEVLSAGDASEASFAQFRQANSTEKVVRIESKPPNSLKTDWPCAPR